jgi:uncharacterized protein YjbI with pentapeptide repeats
MNYSFEIKNRFTGAVLFTCELPEKIAAQSPAKQMGYAVKVAYLADANLADANLAGAYLAGANLAGANLAGAYLADADLAGAYLADANLADANLAGAYLAGAYLADADLGGAYLAGANLADADLAGAYLADADLAGAYLADANLADANLAGADLAGAYLADADLAGAYLAGADLAGALNLPPNDGRLTEKLPVAERYARRRAAFRERNPQVPVIDALDVKILQALQSGGALKMDAWHTCETTHCRAGWAVYLAGSAGNELEKKYGSQRAGYMIYMASTGRVPYFFASNETALADIREQAAMQGPPAAQEQTK